jgi:hypothetical protein
LEQAKQVMLELLVLMLMQLAGVEVFPAIAETITQYKMLL